MLSRINANSTSDYQLLLDENKEKLEQIANQTYQSGTSLEETTETLEQEIRELINLQGSLLLGMKLQQILDSDEVEQAEQELIEKIPKKMKSEGKKSTHRNELWASNYRMDKILYATSGNISQSTETKSRSISRAGCTGHI